MYNSKVTFLQLNQAAHIPGLGSVGPTLPSPSKTYKKLDMTYAVEGVRINIEGFTCLIPWGNVKLASYVASSEEEQKRD